MSNKHKHSWRCKATSSVPLGFAPCSLLIPSHSVLCYSAYPCSLFLWLRFILERVTYTLYKLCTQLSAQLWASDLNTCLRELEGEVEGILKRWMMPDACCWRVDLEWWIFCGLSFDLLQTSTLGKLDTVGERWQCHSHSNFTIYLFLTRFWSWNCPSEVPRSFVMHEEYFWTLGCH